MMGKGWRPSGVFLHTLLIALTVQGVTPDAHDLASRSLIGLFFAQADDLESGPGDAVPADDHDPDEVCSPPRPSPVTLCDSPGCIRFAGLAPTGRDIPSIALACQPLSSVSRLQARGTDSLHFLCRLTC